MPTWLADVFYLYSINYDKAWEQTMPDDAAAEMKMTMWLEALQGFKPETVMRAAKACMLKSPTYPPRVGEVWALCDEFAKTDRFVEHKALDSPADEFGKRQSSRTEEQERIARTQKNPHPPSPLLQEYMAKNNMRLDMPVEEAKEWFYSLMGRLKEKEKSGKWNKNEQ